MYRFFAMSFCLLVAGEAFSVEENSLKDELRDKVDFWQRYGHTCSKYSAYAYPSKEVLQGSKGKAECDDGDGVIFNGMLCASGYEIGCKAVRDSQVYSYSIGEDSEHGKFYRSPWRRDKRSRRTSTLEFSRDQVIGLYFYFIASARERSPEAKERMKAWVDWVQRNDYKVCEEGSGLNCKMTPLNWSFMGRLYDYYRIPLKAVMKNKENRKIENNYATKLIIRQSEGHQTHNYVATALAMDMMGNDGGKGDWMEILANKKEMKGNPFFDYVHRRVCGRSCRGVPSFSDIAKKVIRLCPDESTNAPKRQWSWERENREKAWKKSMGWECVFLGRMLLRERF